MTRRAVFLDRDGVLSVPEFRRGSMRAPLHLDAFHLVTGAPAAVARLRRAGLISLVVTNQPEIASGELLPDVLEEMHQVLRHETGVDGVYVCPHRDRDGCGCRKPKPGLLVAAADEWHIDLAASYMIGDRWRDVQAGEQAGCTTILIGSEADGCVPDHLVRDLDSAVDIILADLAGARPSATDGRR